MLEITVSSRTVNIVVTINVFIAIALLSETFFGFQLNDQLSIVKNPLFVTKCICCFLFVVNLYLANRLEKDGIATPKSSKATKFQVSKLVWGAFQLFVCSCVIHFIAVLFGAPITQSVTETFHFASLLTATAVLPCLCVIGPQMTSWVWSWRRCSSSSLEWSVLISSCGAVLGAWLGAFPVPLDWDRPWQVWPVSCLIGTLLGYSVGLLVSSGWLLQSARRQRKTKAG